LWYLQEFVDGNLPDYQEQSLFFFLDLLDDVLNQASRELD
jgi:hypothetical protein